MDSSIRASHTVEPGADLPLRIKEISLWRRRLTVFWSSNGSRLGSLALLVIVVMAILPVEVLPFDPTLINLSDANRPGLWAGNSTYPLGTDFLGRDMLSRAIHATRLTLVISGSALLIAVVIGIVLGLIAGYFGGWADEVICWLIDVQLAFPVIALAVAIIAMLGGSLVSLIVVLATTSWSTIARMVRAQTMSAHGEVYVEAALAVGVPIQWVLLRHILPNVFSSVLAVAAYEISRLVLTESALSFLGLGVAPPLVTWGGMIGDGRNYIYEAWWTATVPGLMIALLVFAFNFVADGLRDAFDPMSWVKRS